MTDQTCRTCRFYLDSQMRCRRFPPPALTPANLDHFSGSAICAWPVVGYRDWCGEWKQQASDKD